MLVTRGDLDVTRMQATLYVCRCQLQPPCSSHISTFAVPGSLRNCFFFFGPMVWQQSSHRRSGGELAVHDAGLRALACSLVPDSPVRWGRVRRDASDDGWCTFDVVQARQSIQGPLVLEECCAVLHISVFLNTYRIAPSDPTPRFWMLETQARWTCTARWPRKRSLAEQLSTRGVVGTTRHGQCAGIQCIFSRFLARWPTNGRRDHR